MAGRQFIRRSDGKGKWINAAHINELQIALEEDDARIDVSHYPDGTIRQSAIDATLQVAIAEHANVVAAAELAAAAAVPGALEAADLSPYVGPFVDAHIAADPAFSGAAETAVTDAIAGREMLEAPLIVESNLSYAVTDEEGNELWIQADLRGMPTGFALGAVGAPQEANSEVTGRSYSVVDEDGNLTDIDLGIDGQFTDAVVDRLRERLGVIPVPEPEPITLAFWGDSLTEAGWSTAVSASTGLTVRNFGLGGDSSVGINARAGVQPFRITPDGGTIPASGSVAVTVTTHNGKGFNMWSSTALPGRIRGVHGTLDVTATGPLAWQFIRDEAGDPVTVTEPALFIPDAYDTLQTHVHIIWSGNNNAGDTAQVIADNAAFVNALGHANYLILTMMNNDGKPVGSQGYLDVMEINAALIDTYGARCLDIRDYMVNYAIYDAGITPTATDLQNIADGIAPASLRSDTIHHNATGNQLIAAKVEERLREMEIIP